MHAADQEEYADLEDVLDEFEGKRPQRHNIVMSDGWPTDSWYSTKNLRHQRDIGMAQQRKLDMDEIREEIKEEIKDEIKDEILDELDVDEIKDEILDELDVDDLKAEILEGLDALDTESLKAEILDALDAESLKVLGELE